MCFKKWFSNPAQTVPIIPAKRRLITFGRNKYGSGNDLNGCVNDSFNLSDKSTGMKPDFDIRKILDYDAIADRWITEAKSAIQTLSPGATVLIIADSCFSGTVTRAGMGMGLLDIKHPTKNRFYNPGLPPREKKNKMFSNENMNHILMSGCAEHEYSNDAYINGKYAGAFTFFAVMALELGMTYKEWFAEIRKYLPSKDFNQTPQLEGPEYLINRKVFEDETLTLHNSSHGSYTYDKNGDESDGQEEGIYFDRLLIDDEISEILAGIPV
jgi:hypothetical protein